MNTAYQAIVKDQPLQMQREFIHSVFLNCTGASRTEADTALEEVIRAGLLLEVNSFLIEWPHSSFRDYLAGRKLFNLVEADKTYDDFPLDKPNGVNSAAHATKLLTTQSRNLEKRANVFLSLLRRHPTLEIMKVVAEEYSTALDYYMSAHQDIKCDKSIFVATNWGERFLKTYRLIISVVRKNNLSGVDEIPLPQGLNVFFNKKSDFCLIQFSGNKGIRIDDVENFQIKFPSRNRRKSARIGFCLYAPFLLLLDPEIIAYVEVGLWLRTRTQNKLNDWHDGLSSYLSPRNEWIAGPNHENCPSRVLSCVPVQKKQ